MAITFFRCPNCDSAKAYQVNQCNDCDSFLCSHCVYGKGIFSRKKCPLCQSKSIKPVGRIINKPKQHCCV